MVNMLLNQKKTLSLLGKYNIPVSKSVITTGTDALRQCTKVGFPLVLKAVSDKIVHKTDAGGIAVNIQSKAGLKAEIKNMEARIRKIFPKIDLNYMLQKQESGKEVIIGMKRDAQFGPVILFGLGGVFVELFKDVSMRVAPLTKNDIEEMIKEVKAYKILSGYRGEKPVNIASLAGIISRISRLSLKEKHISEIDLNPVIVNGKKAVVVDARVILEYTIMKK